MSEKRPPSQGARLTPVAVPQAVDPAHDVGKADWLLVPDVAQDAPGFTKQWYAHATADLFVWTDGNGEIGTFQFCFDKEDGEQMVAWDRHRLGSAGSVDTGESDPLANRSPVMREANERTARAPAVWNAVKRGLPDELILFIERVMRWGQSRGATET